MNNKSRPNHSRVRLTFFRNSLVREMTFRGEERSQPAD